MNQPPHSEENHERWLVSYADYVTLLFAFFVVMFAISQADRSKAQQVSESVKKAYGSSERPAVPPRTVPVKRAGPPETPVEGLAEFVPSLEFLSKELEEEIKSGKVRISMEARGLVVTLQETAFFRSGDDSILPQTEPAIAKIADAIRKISNPVRLEGHTDSTPICTLRFKSNWHLSTARAISMMEMLRDHFGLAPNRFAVAGYADTVPVETNDTTEGRARNRRVDIVILSRIAVGREPAALAGRAGK